MNLLACAGERELHVGERAACSRACADEKLIKQSFPFKLRVELAQGLVASEPERAGGWRWNGHEGYRIRSSRPQPRRACADGWHFAQVLPVLAYVYRYTGNPYLGRSALGCIETDFCKLK